LPGPSKRSCFNNLRGPNKQRCQTEHQSGQN
jgi:hypothetical protein